MTTGLPYVTAKWAASLDGKIAAHTGDSQWISGPESRRDVHRLRGQVCAVAGGLGTALADDPRLNAREVDAPGLRAVFAEHLRVSNPVRRQTSPAPWLRNAPAHWREGIFAGVIALAMWAVLVPDEADVSMGFAVPVQIANLPEGYEIEQPEDLPFPRDALRTPRGKRGGRQRVVLPEGYLSELDDDTPPGADAEDPLSGG